MGHGAVDAIAAGTSRSRPERGAGAAVNESQTWTGAERYDVAGCTDDARILARQIRLPERFAARGVHELERAAVDETNRVVDQHDGPGSVTDLTVPHHTTVSCVETGQPAVEIDQSDGRQRIVGGIVHLGSDVERGEWARRRPLLGSRASVVPTNARFAGHHDTAVGREDHLCIDAGSLPQRTPSGEFNRCAAVTGAPVERKDGCVIGDSERLRCPVRDPWHLAPPRNTTR